MRLQITLENQQELLGALQNQGNLKRLLSEAFDGIGEHARSESRNRAPHDRGKLRASITYKQEPRDRRGMPTGVRIGTIGGNPPRYAAWMEYGTGTVNDHPTWPKTPHKMGATAARALTAWGNRKSLNGMGAFWTIKRRGGIKPKRYLRSVLEDNRAKYINVIRIAVRRASING